MDKLKLDNYYMKMALELAAKGEGVVNPNPLVGAVIVKDGQVVGKGYHKLYGGPHAEVYAIKDAGHKAKGADIYVTLEPCSHYGKTPPCVEAILKAGIKRVIAAMTDPNPLVAGKGLQLLKQNGVEVISGVMEEEAKKLNEIFIKFITEKIPFIILKTAMTLDGKIASTTGESKWITGEKSRKVVHQIRNRVMAIMVGIGTVLKDNPLLTTRLEEGGRSPKAVIVDSKLKIPLECKIFNSLKEREIIIACTEIVDKDKKDQLEAMGVRIIVCPENTGNKVDLDYLVRELGNLGIDSILLEGGGELNFSAINSKVVDKIICFIAPKILGGVHAKTPVEGEGIKNLRDAVILKNIKISTIDNDVVIEGYI